MKESDFQTINNLKTLPKEIDLLQKSKKTKIGIPAEIIIDEKRIAIIPDDVATLVEMDIEIYIESGAGEGANFTDLEYSEAGAIITTDKKQVFSHCDIIIKITPLTDIEIDMLGTNKILISALHLSTLKADKIKKLQEKRTTCLAYELFNDSNNFNPFLHIIGEIIGSSSVMIAAELMSNVYGGNGLMLGGLTGLPPAEVVILGTDISAKYAIRIATGLGANIKVFDYTIENLINFHNIFGQHLYTSILNYKTLSKSLNTADVVINTLEKQAQQDYILPLEFLTYMKTGAVIIDLKVDSGSVIESSHITTFENPTFVKSGVIHYCVPNMASRVSRTSSVAISNILLPFLINILNSGSIIHSLQSSISCRNSTYLLKGVLTDKTIANTFKMDFTDINLIIHIF